MMAGFELGSLEQKTLELNHDLWQLVYNSIYLQGKCPICVLNKLQFHFRVTLKGHMASLYLIVSVHCKTIGRKMLTSKINYDEQEGGIQTVYIWVWMLPTGSFGQKNSSTIHHSYVSCFNPLFIWIRVTTAHISLSLSLSLSLSSNSKHWLLFSSSSIKLVFSFFLKSAKKEFW